MTTSRAPTIRSFDDLARGTFHSPGELAQIEQAKASAGAAAECRRYHLEWEVLEEEGDLTLVKAIFYHDGQQYKYKIAP